MAKCFSYTATQDSCYRYSFSRAGLKSSTTDLGDGTIMHCWARCVAAVMDAQRVSGTMDVMGLSYGGFVAYSMAAQFPERVGRVVLGCAGVCLEEKDMEDGMFQVKSVDEAAEILLPQTPEKCRQLLRLSFYKPPPVTPSCFLADFIEVGNKF
ncbi:unnamed protein product [Linum tenue]|uniref:AB hydrolase-1 domain-containing protein n=1 Tax=Linum tenue TaxID=586396 RepID=A0AAV0KLJ3_9ROSI|nr:unnamed protein product [Linum tenue]